MGIIFGRKKQVSRVTEQDKAVLQLKQQRDKLRQYQKRIELALESDRELAKKLLNNGQRERAKLLLRKKRFQEDILKKTDNQLENLEKLTHDIEFAQVELQVIAGLRKGNEALKKVNEFLKIEDIEKILDETREGAAKQEEINALLGGALSDDDEAAIEDELTNILEESMPKVPDEEVAQSEMPEEVTTEVPEEVTPEKVPKKERERQKPKPERVALEA